MTINNRQLESIVDACSAEYNKHIPYAMRPMIISMIRRAYDDGYSQCTADFAEQYIGREPSSWNPFADGPPRKKSIWQRVIDRTKHL